MISDPSPGGAVLHAVVHLAPISNELCSVGRRDGEPRERTFFCVDKLSTSQWSEWVMRSGWSGWIFKCSNKHIHFILIDIHVT